MILPNHILEKMSPADRAKLGKAGMTMAEALAKAEAKSERDLQKLISNELLRRDIWFHRAAMNKRTTGTLGTPDFLFAVNGLACAMEVKFAAGKLKPEQERAIADMRANGWRVAVVRSFEETRAFLEEVGA